MTYSHKDKTAAVSIAIIAAFATTGLLAQNAHALTPEERKEKREEVREARGEAKEARGEIREERSEAREERTEERQENRKERLDDRSDRKEERFDSRWARMEEKLENIEERLSSAGADTSTLSDAINTLDGLASDVKTSFSAFDEALEGDDSAAITAAKEDVREARDAMRTYFKETVRPTVRTLIDDIKNEDA